MREAILQPEYFIMEMANFDITKRETIQEIEADIETMVEWKLAEILYKWRE